MERIRDKEIFKMMDEEREKATAWLREVKHVKESDLQIFLKGWDDGFGTLQARLRDKGIIDPRTDKQIEEENNG